MTRLTLYPAIDLKDGACVGLKRGAMDQATVCANNPTGPKSVVPYRTYAMKNQSIFTALAFVQKA